MDKIYELLHLSFREIWAVEKLGDYLKTLLCDFSFSGFFAKCLVAFFHSFRYSIFTPFWA